MKRFALLASTALLGMLPGVASARPHFFFGFPIPIPFFAPPAAIVVNEPAPCVAPAPAVVVDQAPQCAPAPVVVVDPAPQVYYAPVPVVVDYGYYHPGFYYRHYEPGYRGARYYYRR